MIPYSAVEEAMEKAGLGSDDNDENEGSWFSKAMKDFGSFLGSGAGAKLGGMGLAALVNQFAPGFNQPKIPVVGYQGEIPRYAAVRERVPMPAQMDTDRRPGSGGRRYFSDTIFAQQPETTPMSIEDARKKAQQQAQGIASTQRNPQPTMAQGGILAMREGRYLSGSTDGMADKVPARIDNGQEARLSDGEFVIPADVVSHLGNGNSEAGAKVLHSMMDRVRKERTGNPKQGKEIDPKRMLPA